MLISKQFDFTNSLMYTIHETVERDDKINAAYQWLDAQIKTDKQLKEDRGLERLIGDWSGQDITNQDVAIAAHRQPTIEGEYPFLNLDSGSTFPAADRLRGISTSFARKTDEQLLLAFYHFYETVSYQSGGDAGIVRTFELKGLPEAYLDPNDFCAQHSNCKCYYCMFGQAGECGNDWRRLGAMLRLLVVSAILTLLTASGTVAFELALFDAILEKNVVQFDDGHSTKVDYRKLQRHEDELDAYLDTLTEVSRSTFDAWDKASQLAFLINAYNGWTLKLIVEKYPDLQSIKDLGSLFRSPWKKRFIPLLEETRSLDDIEHGLIRGSGRYNEPRIHFAVNCASIGCPALRNEAYRADILDTQLEESTRLFLEDRSRNRADNQNTLHVSSIFKWYKKDFERGCRGAQTLEQFLALYADSLGLSQEQTEMLKNGAYKIEYLDYDWGLNDLKHE